MAHRSVSPRWRALSLILIGLVAGTLLLTPAGAHIGTPNHLWKKHIKAKAIAQINKHLNKPTLISVPCGDWAEASSSSSISRATNVCGFFGTAANQFFNVEAPLPAALQGNAVKVTGIEICYDASSAAVLDKVFASLNENVNEAGSVGTIVLDDETDRTDEACRLHTMNTTLTPDNVLQFVIRVDYVPAGTLSIARTTIRIQRTGSAAPALSAPSAQAPASRAPDPGLGEA